MPPSKTKRKPSQEIMERLEMDVVQARSELTAAEEVAGLMDSPGWKRIQDMIATKLRFVDARLESFEDMDHEGRLLFLKERKDLRFFSGVADDFKHDLPALNEALAKATRERDDYRRRVEQAQ